MVNNLISKTSENSERHPLGFSAIIAVAADLVTIVGFMLINTGNLSKALGRVGTIPALLLLIGIGFFCFWLTVIILYIREKKENKIILPESLDYKYSLIEKARKKRLRIIQIFPVFILLIFVLHLFIQNFQGNKIIVLVADFDGPDPKNYGIMQTLLNELEASLKEYNDIRIEALGITITEQQGREKAREIGKSHQARIVLWGWYTKTTEKVRMTIHFELLDKAHLFLLNQDYETINFDIEQLESFVIQDLVSDKIGYLTLITAAVARYEAKEYDEAIRIFNKVLGQSLLWDNFINPYFIYLFRGNIYEKKMDYDLAIADYSQVIKSKPDDIYAYALRGLVYLEKKEYDLSINDYNHVIKFETNEGPLSLLYLARGMAYYRKGACDSAITDFSQTIQLKSNDAGAYLFRGRAYLCSDKCDSAINDLNKSLRLCSNNGVVYIVRGTAYSLKGDYDHAIADYSQAISLGRNDSYVYHSRSVAYFRKGDYDKAIADLSHVMILNPTDSVAYANRGTIYWYKKEYNQAIADLSQAIKLNLNSAEVYRERGEIYHRIGNYTQAIADFNQAIKLNPNIVDEGVITIPFPDFLFSNKNSSIVGQTKEENKHAIDKYSQAIIRNHNDVLAYKNRGIAYAKLGDYNRAINDFSLAIKIDHNDADAYKDRGRTYCLKGEYDCSIADFSLAIKLKSNDPDAYKFRGITYSITNCFSQNLDVFRFFSTGLRLLFYRDSSISSCQNFL